MYDGQVPPLDLDAMFRSYRHTTPEEVEFVTRILESPEKAWLRDNRERLPDLLVSYQIGTHGGLWRTGAACLMQLLLENPDMPLCVHRGLMELYDTQPTGTKLKNDLVKMTLASPEVCVHLNRLDSERKWLDIFSIYKIGKEGETCDSQRYGYLYHVLSWAKSLRSSARRSQCPGYVRKNMAESDEDEEQDMAGGEEDDDTTPGEDDYTTLGEDGDTTRGNDDTTPDKDADTTRGQEGQTACGGKSSPSMGFSDESAHEAEDEDEDEDDIDGYESADGETRIDEGEWDKILEESVDNGDKAKPWRWHQSDAEDEGENADNEVRGTQEMAAEDNPTPLGTKVASEEEMTTEPNDTDAQEMPAEEGLGGYEVMDQHEPVPDDETEDSGQRVTLSTSQDLQNHVQEEHDDVVLPFRRGSCLSVCSAIDTAEMDLDADVTATRDLGPQTLMSLGTVEPEKSRDATSTLGRSHRQLGPADTATEREPAATTVPNNSTNGKPTRIIASEDLGAQETADQDQRGCETVTEDETLATDGLCTGRKETESACQEAEVMGRGHDNSQDQPDDVPVYGHEPDEVMAHDDCGHGPHSYQENESGLSKRKASSVSAEITANVKRLKTEKAALMEEKAVLIAEGNAKSEQLQLLKTQYSENVQQFTSQIKEQAERIRTLEELVSKKSAENIQLKHEHEAELFHLLGVTKDA